MHILCSVDPFSTSLIFAVFIYFKHSKIFNDRKINIQTIRNLKFCCCFIENNFYRMQSKTILKQNRLLYLFCASQQDKRLTGSISRRTKCLAVIVQVLDIRSWNTSDVNFTFHHSVFDRINPTQQPKSMQTLLQNWKDWYSFRDQIRELNYLSLLCEFSSD